MSVTLSKRPKRLRVLVEGHLDRPQSQDDVRVRDISKGGVLVETFGPPPEEDDVILVCESHSLEGCIMWRDGAWLGVKLGQDMPQDAWDTLAANASGVGLSAKKRDHDGSKWNERIDLPGRTIKMSAPQN